MYVLSTRVPVWPTHASMHGCVDGLLYCNTGMPYSSIAIHSVHVYRYYTCTMAIHTCTYTCTQICSPDTRVYGTIQCIEQYCQYCNSCYSSSTRVQYRYLLAINSSMPACHTYSSAYSIWPYAILLLQYGHIYYIREYVHVCVHVYE